MVDMPFDSFLFITLATLVSQGLICLNDGIYVDSLLLMGLRKPERVHHLTHHCSQIGRPLVGQITAFIAKANNLVMTYRIIALSSMWLIGLLTYMICRATGLLDSATALAVALFTVAYTGHQMTVEFCVARRFYAFQVFFLFAILLALLSVHHGPAIWLALSVLSLPFLFIGFHLEAQLTYAFALPLLLALNHLFFLPNDSSDPALVAMTAVLYCIAPVLFWKWSNIAHGCHGDYQNSYRPRFNPEITKKYALRVFTYGVLGAITAPFKHLFGLRRGWLSLFPAAMIAGLFYHFELISVRISGAFGIGLMTAGLVLLVLGNAPFVLVLQPAGLRGWSTKNNVLIALPTALMLTGLIGLILQGRLFSAGLGFIVAYFLMYLNMIHIDTMAIWAKHHSILRNISQIPQAREAAVFAFHDRHPIRGSFDEHPEHFTLSVVFLLDLLWGQLCHLVIVEPTPKTEGYTQEEIGIAIRGTTMASVFDNMDRKGRQAAITVDNGRLDLSTFQAGLRYFWYRWFDKKGLDPFLAGLTTVTFAELQAPSGEQAGRPWSPGVAPFVGRWRNAAEDAPFAS
ncbi:MAG: hypothetical protein A2051_13175 [Desulfovibrionales bacterium GWA2_65_9]|nr:MAG: hypothetical protein A2051_13175 [Desulfovibrionales bacterium GWA2_65_9]